MIYIPSAVITLGLNILSLCYNSLLHFSGFFYPGHQQKVLHSEDAESLEKTPQGSGHGAKTVRDQGVSGQCSYSYSLVLQSPARSRKFDLMVHMSPFQLETVYDSAKDMNFPVFFLMLVLIITLNTDPYRLTRKRKRGQKNKKAEQRLLLHPPQCSFVIYAMCNFLAMGCKFLSSILQAFLSYGD